MSEELQSFIKATEASRISKMKEIWNILNDSEKIEAKLFISRLSEAKSRLLEMGIRILDKAFHEQIYGSKKEKDPLKEISTVFSIFDNLIKESLEDDNKIDGISRIISNMINKNNILDRVRDINEDLYLKIISHLPNGRKSEDPFIEDHEDLVPRKSKIKDENKDDDRIIKKAKLLGRYYRELIENELDSFVIESLILQESENFDTRYEEEN